MSFQTLNLQICIKWVFFWRAIYSSPCFAWSIFSGCFFYVSFPLALPVFATQMSPWVAASLKPSVSISVHLLSVQPTTNCVCPPPKSPSKWQCLCPVPTSQVSSKTLSLSLSTLLLSLLPPGWQRGVLLPTTRGAAADTLLLSLGHCRRKEGGQRKWDIQS